MPELPDVEVFRRYLQATALHQEIETVRVEEERLVQGLAPRTLQRKLKGRSFESTERRGKHLFVRLDDGGHLALHFGMTGELAYCKRAEDEPEYAAVVFVFTNGWRLAVVSRRKIGKVRYVDDLDAFFEKEDLGPDALENCDAKTFRQALEGRRGAVKSALMNQSVIAGVGNIYSDEILFQAGVHPKTALDALDADALKEMHRVMRRVLRLAVKRGADPGKLPGSWIIPHRRGDGKCPRCGDDLRRIDVSGRTACFCPCVQGDAAD